jgi:hypothetical protein
LQWAATTQSGTTPAGHTPCNSADMLNQLAMIGPKPMKKLLARAVTLLMILGAVGCDDDSFTNACTAIYVYGVSIEVKDAVTGAPLEGVTAEIRDGAFVDPSVVVSTSIVNGAGERAGTYSIVIRKAGYRDWTKTGVVVTADRCHVKGVRLVAALDPLP